MLERYLPKIEFSSYEDFYDNYRVKVPDNFNFGFDVVDEMAKSDPNARALVWCDDKGAELNVSFAKMSRWSNQAACWFAAQGIKKGDKVMLILKRRAEYWPAVVGLHKLGA